MQPLQLKPSQHGRSVVTSPFRSSRQVCPSPGQVHVAMQCGGIASVHTGEPQKPPSQQSRAVEPCGPGWSSMHTSPSAAQTPPPSLPVPAELLAPPAELLVLPAELLALPAEPPPMPLLPLACAALPAAARPPSPASSSPPLQLQSAAPSKPSVRSSAVPRIMRVMLSSSGRSCQTQARSTGLAQARRSFLARTRL